MFSIFDTKADVYSQPFYALTDHAAIRTFTDAVNLKDSPYNRHPGDYQLFAIGDFDDRTGDVTPHPKQHLGNAISFVAEPPIPLFDEINQRQN